jgi:hypothetical protein
MVWYVLLRPLRPELFPTQASLSPKQSTLVLASSAALISTLLLLLILLVGGELLIGTFIGISDYNFKLVSKLVM